ncbi:MAG: hypothetical protein HY039_08940 [Nitrospirae bacterium]|nr:hypothetical protein [Nitrospirota bacterium]
MEIKLRDGLYGYSAGDRDEDQRRMGLAVYGCTAAILTGVGLLFAIAWRWGDAIMQAMK